MELAGEKRQRRLDSKKQWLKDNPEKARAACKRWRNANKSKARALTVAWVKNNPEKAKLSLDTWKRNNPEVMRFHEKKRRARKAGAVGSHTYAEWKARMAYFGHRCAYCLTPLVRATRDHIVPLVRGGANYIDNVVPACKLCNNRKHARPLLQFLQHYGSSLKS